VVFIGVYAGLTMACVPGPVLAGLSGVLFGTLEGSLLALVGAVVGASLAFLLARHVAGDLVARVGGRRVTALAAWVDRRGFRSMILARATPGAPFAAVSYAAGLAPVRLRDFAVATGIVAIPRTFAYAAIGGSAGHLRSPAVAIAGFVILGVGALGLVLGLREYAGVRRAARAGGGEVDRAAAGGTPVGGVPVGGVPVGGGGVRVGAAIVGVTVAGGTGRFS
jgi:uncharacterized membrane protein YdjX (TVP38/TMEM64 family)